MITGGNIYDWLQHVRKRPGMWVGESTNQLTNLETMIHGYYAALPQHGITEDVPALNESKFALWLYQKTSIGAALGWAHIIHELHPDPEEAFESFFKYLEEYKNQLRH